MKRADEGPPDGRVRLKSMLAEELLETLGEPSEILPIAHLARTSVIRRIFRHRRRSSSTRDQPGNHHAISFLQPLTIRHFALGQDELVRSRLQSADKTSESTRFEPFRRANCQTTAADSFRA